MYGDTPVPLYIVETVVEEYSVFSKANLQHGGFNGLYKRETDHYSQELFNYRLEMMANQVLDELRKLRNNPSKIKRHLGICYNIKDSELKNDFMFFGCRMA